MNPLIQLQKAAPVFVVTLVCVGLLPKTQAVGPPPPGGYPNFTTAAGDHALRALTSGVGNTALGTFSLFSVTAGSVNTAIGTGALLFNTADENTATGAGALLSNTTGNFNTANGVEALENNTIGIGNTANGADALFNNTTAGFLSRRFESLALCGRTETAATTTVMLPTAVKKAREDPGRETMSKSC